MLIDANSTFVELLRDRAQQRPDEAVYTFLGDGEREVEELSYGAVDRRARAIAVALQESCSPGARVILLMPPDLSFMVGLFGCFYAGCVAVPVALPDPARLNRTLPRLLSIVRDASPEIVMTTRAVHGLLAGLFAARKVPELQGARWLQSDSVDLTLAPSWRAPEAPPVGDAPAMFQYTSGSTGDPKGVILSHTNLLHNTASIQQKFAIRAGQRLVSWLPTFHDMGLAFGVLIPPYSGTHAYLMSPLDFGRRPARWVEAMSRYQASGTGGPNFAYDLCARKISPVELEALDLSRWELAFNGAEPVRAATLARFTEVFGPRGFKHEAHFPCYGLAESTCMVTGGVFEAAPVVLELDTRALEGGRVELAGEGVEARTTLIGCGSAIPDSALAIVEPETRARVDEGELGEIWFSGPSVGRGFWQKPEQSEEIFAAKITGEGGRLYMRTGDLGFVKDGELFVAGRIKDLIIIRGRNHYPQDIEAAVEGADPALRPGCGAAFSVDVGDEEQLVVVHEIDTRKPVDPPEIAARIRQQVAANFGVHVYAVVFLRPRTILKTSSGKIQRAACRAAFLAEKLDFITRSVIEDRSGDRIWMGPAPTADEVLALDVEDQRGPVVDFLRAQISEMLGISEYDVDPARPLIQLGMDSIIAADLEGLCNSQLKARIEYHLSIADEYERITVNRLAEAVLAAWAAVARRSAK